MNAPTKHAYEIERLQKLCRFLELAHGARDAKVQQLHADGVPARTLVKATGLSRQRVHQIVTGPAAGLHGVATVTRHKARTSMDKAEQLMNQARKHPRQAHERRIHPALTPADVDRLIDVLRNE